MAHLTDAQRTNQRTHNLYGRTHQFLRSDVAPKVIDEILVPNASWRRVPKGVGTRVRLGKAGRKAAKRARVRELKARQARARS